MNHHAPTAPSKHKRFIGLALFQMSRFVGSAHVVALSTALIGFYNFDRINPLSYNTLGVLAGSVVGLAAVAAWKCKDKLLDSMDKKHTLRSMYSQESYCLNEFIKLISPMNSRLKAMNSQEEKKDYLLNLEAQLTILGRVPVSVHNQQSNDLFLKHYSGLIDTVNEHVKTEESLKKKIKDNPRLATEISQELRNQNLTLLDIGYDFLMYDRIMEQHKEKSKDDDFETPAFPVAEDKKHRENLEVLLSLALKNTSLDERMTKKLGKVVNKIQDKNLLNRLVKNINENIDTGTELDLHAFLDSMENNAMLDKKLFSQLEKKASEIELAHLNASIDIAQRETQKKKIETFIVDGEENKFAPREQKIQKVQTINNSSLFLPGLIDSISAEKLNGLSSSIPHNGLIEIKERLTKLSTQLRALDQAQDLMSIESQMELRILVNKNLPDFMSYLNVTASLLPESLKDKALRTVGEGIELFALNVREIEKTLGQTMLGQMQATTRHMEHKNQYLKSMAK